jgi:hypothetical protein
MRTAAILLACAAALPLAPLQIPEYTAPQVRRLTAKTLRTFTAPEARQGVAADSRHFYAVDNTVVAKYEIA